MRMMLGIRIYSWLEHVLFLLLVVLLRVLLLPLFGHLDHQLSSVLLFLAFHYVLAQEAGGVVLLQGLFLGRYVEGSSSHCTP